VACKFVYSSCDQLILRNISKIGATKAKCVKFAFFPLGLRPRRRWALGSLQRSPNSLAVFQGPTSKGKKGKGWGGAGEGRKDKGGKGRGGGEIEIWPTQKFWCGVPVAGS